MKTKKVKQNETDKQLIAFLSTLSANDYQGSATKKEVKQKAESFLENGGYNDSAEFMGLNVHDAILCLIYDAI